MANFNFQLSRICQLEIFTVKLLSFEEEFRRTKLRYFIGISIIKRRYRGGRIMSS